MTGILLLDKPYGLSSNRALQIIKRLLGAGKAGHVGSLDPLATGMLPICLDEATKIQGEILSGRKRYAFTVKLGERTQTGDVEGSVVETMSVPPLSEPQILAVLKTFMGTIAQVPPMYSAIKQAGQPLYKLARAGVQVERAAREIQIHELDLTGLESSSLELTTLCSKGTYIRVLAEDIARALGTCGHVTHLRRVYVEPFQDEPMHTLESVEAQLKAGCSPRLLAADRGVPQLAAVHLAAGAALRVRQGQAVAIDSGLQAGKVRLYDDQGAFFGLGEAVNGFVKPRRLFVLVGEGVRE